MEQKSTAQLSEEINEAISKVLEDNDIDKNCFKETIKTAADDIATAIYKELILPKNVFIDCSSPKDADILIKIRYTKNSATSFYIGNVSDDLLAAQLKVMKHMDEHNILFYYISPYRTSYFMDGHCFDSENVYMERLKEK